jgi:hypothetical protein
MFVEVPSSLLKLLLNKRIRLRPPVLDVPNEAIFAAINNSSSVEPSLMLVCLFTTLLLFTASSSNILCILRLFFFLNIGLLDLISCGIDAVSKLEKRVALNAKDEENDDDDAKEEDDDDDAHSSVECVEFLDGANGCRDTTKEEDPHEEVIVEELEEVDISIKLLSLRLLNLTFVSLYAKEETDGTIRFEPLLRGILFCNDGGGGGDDVEDDAVVNGGGGGGGGGGATGIGLFSCIRATGELRSNTSLLAVVVVVSNFKLNDDENADDDENICFVKDLSLLNAIGRKERVSMRGTVVPSVFLTLHFLIPF